MGNGLSLADLAAMVALPDASAALKLLRPGDRLEIAHRDGQVMNLQREIDEIKLLSIARGESGFQASTIERAVDIRVVGTHGSIDSSLFEAGTAAGISDRTTMDLAGIFEWDIDFIQDVREGDRFAQDRLRVARSPGRAVGTGLGGEQRGALFGKLRAHDLRVGDLGPLERQLEP